MSLRRAHAVSPSLLVPCRGAACKGAILARLKAVNPPACAAQYNRPDGTNPRDGARRRNRSLRRGRAKGRKSYWDEFHGDVTVKRSPLLNPAKFGAGRTLHQRFLGSD